MKLSDKQKRIVEYIETYQRENPFPPSIREIGSAVDLPSTSSVRYHLNHLVKIGLLQKSDKYVPRGYYLMGEWKPLGKAE